MGLFVLMRRLLALLLLCLLQFSYRACINSRERLLRISSLIHLRCNHLLLLLNHRFLCRISGSLRRLFLPIRILRFLGPLTFFLGFRTASLLIGLQFLLRVFFFLFLLLLILILL